MSDLPFNCPDSRVFERGEVTWDHFQTRNEATTRLLWDARRASKDEEASILVLGEEGTGKVALARAIHRHSPIATKPLVVVNPGTSAVDVEQAIRDAADGCLLVREPSLFHPEALLRIGESAEARLIVTSTRSIKELDGDNDSLFHLCIPVRACALTTIPLRSRTEDVLPYFDGFGIAFAAEIGRAWPGRTPELTLALTKHLWPGNFPELVNAARRTVLRGTAGALAEARLASAPWMTIDSPEDLVPFEEMRRLYVRHAVQVCGNNLAQAARRIKVTENTVHKYCKGGPPA